MPPLSSTRATCFCAAAGIARQHAKPVAMSALRVAVDIGDLLRAKRLLVLPRSAAPWTYDSTGLRPVVLSLAMPLTIVIQVTVVQNSDRSRRRHFIRRPTGKSQSANGRTFRALLLFGAARTREGVCVAREQPSTRSVAARGRSESRLVALRLGGPGQFSMTRHDPFAARGGPTNDRWDDGRDRGRRANRLVVPADPIEPRFEFLPAGTRDLNPGRTPCRGRCARELRCPSAPVSALPLTEPLKHLWRVSWD